MRPSSRTIAQGDVYFFGGLVVVIDGQQLVSSATGLPAKILGERTRVTSISSVQPAIGTTGQTVSAT
jgi:hypothetical protein